MFEINRSTIQHSSEFEMKTLGTIKNILSIEIHRDRKIGKLYLSQKSYFVEARECFKMQDSKLVSTTLANHFGLSTNLSLQSEEEKKYMSHVSYANVVGNLVYAMIFTHPNILHFIIIVNRFIKHLGKTHWQAVKWILQYLSGTVDVGLVFDKINGLDGCAIGFVDLNYASDHEKRSLIDYMFTLSDCLVSWNATLQAIVSLSTIETKYMAMIGATKEAIWFQRFSWRAGPEERFDYCTL